MGCFPDIECTHSIPSYFRWITKAAGTADANDWLLAFGCTRLYSVYNMYVTCYSFLLAMARPMRDVLTWVAMCVCEPPTRRLLL